MLDKTESNGPFQKSLDWIDEQTLELHKRFPTLAVASNGIWDVMQTTRDQLCEDAKVIQAIPVEIINKAQTAVDETAAQLPPPLGDALRKIISITPVGIVLNLSACGSGGYDAISKSANSDLVRQVKSGGDYATEMAGWVAGGILAQLIAVAFYYKIGAIGHGGKYQIDDKLWSLFYGLLSQLATTLYALSEGYDSLFLIGVAGGVVTTGGLAGIKAWIKGPKDGSNQ